MSALSKADDKFLAAVTAAGGEVLSPTNPGVGVVYENNRGVRNWNSEAKAVREHLSKRVGGSLASVTVRGRRTGKGTVDRLLSRDGAWCFFCGKALGADITVEHLVPIAHGGSNHISNLLLAHGECNRDAGHLSGAEKVAMALRLRSAVNA